MGDSGRALSSRRLGAESSARLRQPRGLLAWGTVLGRTALGRCVRQHTEQLGSGGGIPLRRPRPAGRSPAASAAAPRPSHPPPAGRVRGQAQARHLPQAPPAALRCQQRQAGHPELGRLGTAVRGSVQYGAALQALHSTWSPRHFTGHYAQAWGGVGLGGTRLVQRRRDVQVGPEVEQAQQHAVARAGGAKRAVAALQRSWPRHGNAGWLPGAAPGIVYIQGQSTPASLQAPWRGITRITGQGSAQAVAPRP